MGEPVPVINHRLAHQLSVSFKQRQVIESAARLGIEALTLYAFSMENWRRPHSEVDFLMRLLREYLRKELPVIHENNIRLLVIGRGSQLPATVRRELDQAMKLTSGNTGMKLVVALNYGGRAEIVDAVNAALEEKRRAGETDVAIDEKAITDHLYTAGLPDPDLLIRTSGELRVSNFMLWQLAYAELVFVDRLWPDFDARDLRGAVEPRGEAPTATFTAARVARTRSTQYRATSWSTWMRSTAACRRTRPSASITVSTVPSGDCRRTRSRMICASCRYGGSLAVGSILLTKAG